MLMQMVDRPTTIPAGKDSETLTFKALLNLNVAVHAQVCRVFCLVYMPFFGLAQAGPRFRSSICGSHQLPVYLKYSVASATRTHMRM